MTEEQKQKYIDSMQEDPCDGCTNRKGCITCENGELRETVQEEPVSEELWEAAQIYYEELQKEKFEGSDVIDAFKAGTLWQKQQMEAYRIKHCNSITNEQAELEDKFVSSHIEKNNRMPTYLDAIEYGIEYGKQQMMKDAVEEIVDVDSNGLACVNVDGYLPGDKVRVYIFKEE